MGETLANKNQAYWNGASQNVFKDKWVHDLQNQISEFLTGNPDWIGVQLSGSEDARSAKMMDYACGNGIVSRSLHDLFAMCIGVDLSDGMLDKYRGTATELGLDESRMLAVQGDLLAPTVQPTRPPLSEDELSNFDLVAICMALHHVEDIHLATRRLAERLRPGGVLLIIDWATRDSLKGSEQPNNSETETASQSATGSHQHHQHHHHGHSHIHNHNHTDGPDVINPKHPAAHTISHDSFSQSQIFSLFEQAGCGDSKFVLADRLSPVPGARSGQMQLFWARATKL
ncbi:hypothetical protein N7456_004173 [Penicillium angulare]|uniref:Methyltransferase type 11 domain-containing protein n=1 Tax=Penicillium angulare TaxID=116970 RepID=A0A9W9FW21_9EURO|nr:hypothetical protein N7456_004173 [Penicillium angulare]